MKLSNSKKIKYVLYLAVLPKYRTECIRILRENLNENLSIYISPAHLDESVRSGIPSEFYKEVRIARVFGHRAFIQLGSWAEAIAATTTVVDLNPRSITAWLILLTRFAARRRTLVWGHIHPQAGAASKTAALRRFMRRLANGTLSYTYRDAQKAVSDLPGSAVWTAPNSLYKRDSIKPAPEADDCCRNSVLYVGRFAPAKKISLLIEGFAEAAKSHPEMNLILVGGGSEERTLRELADRLGVSDRVEFPGWIDDLDSLTPYYSRAFCTASTGFAGLGLTQSLGFGIPMIVADKEPHSPEIELDASGGVSYFESDSSTDLARAIARQWTRRDLLPDLDLSDYTKVRYSAEAMADGLKSALEDRVVI